MEPKASSRLNLNRQITPELRNGSQTDLSFEKFPIMIPYNCESIEEFHCSYIILRCVALEIDKNSTLPINKGSIVYIRGKASNSWWRDQRWWTGWILHGESILPGTFEKKNLIVLSEWGVRIDQNLQEDAAILISKPETITHAATGVNKLFSLFGGNPNRNSKGKTPLSHEDSSPKIDKKMMRDIKERQRKGISALSASVSYGDQEVKWLLRKAVELLKTGGDEEEMLSVLITLCALAWPYEQIPDSRRAILASGLLPTLIDFAGAGKLVFHRKLNPKDVQIGPFIAEGAAAKLFTCTWKNKKYAVKRFDVDHISFDPIEFKKEVALLCLSESPNLVPCIGACIDEENQNFILMELMSKGTLSQFLRDWSRYLDYRTSCKFASDIATGMKWLHSINIIHRDLKPLNILINNDMTCKIIDLGASIATSNKISMMTANIGTPAWIAPELFSLSSHAQYDKKADVYSFGIILWEILTAKTPYEDVPMWQIPEMVEKGCRPPIPEGAPNKYVRLMQKCWHRDPEQRPSFETLERDFQKLVLEFEIGENQDATKTSRWIPIGDHRKKRTPARISPSSSASANEFLTLLQNKQQTK